jgi:hypothetical protein
MFGTVQRDQRDARGYRSRQKDMADSTADTPTAPENAKSWRSPRGSGIHDVAVLVALRTPPRPARDDPGRHHPRAEDGSTYAATTACAKQTGLRRTRPIRRANGALQDSGICARTG